MTDWAMQPDEMKANVYVGLIWFVTSITDTNPNLSLLTTTPSTVKPRQAESENLD